MELRELDFSEIERVYNEYMKKDFQSTELKPLAMILERIKMGKYVLYGLFEKNELIAYAALAFENEFAMALLDYYAVVEKHRGKRFGSAMLTSLKSEFKQGFIAEVAIPQFAIDDAERLERDGRIIFYVKNKLINTNIQVSVFEHKYYIFYYSYDEKNNEYIKDRFIAIYKDLLGEGGLKKNIEFMTN